MVARKSEVARFAVGDLIRHRLFDYRGVVVDVDPCFNGDESWYQQVALTRPPKNRPWYHVLVDRAAHTTYVAERNLLPDTCGEAVRHPLVARFFDRLQDGRYVSHTRTH